MLLIRPWCSPTGLSCFLLQETPLVMSSCRELLSSPCRDGESRQRLTRLMIEIAKTMAVVRQRRDPSPAPGPHRAARIAANPMSARGERNVQCAWRASTTRAARVLRGGQVSPYTSAAALHELSVGRLARLAVRDRETNRMGLPQVRPKP